MYRNIESEAQKQGCAILALNGMPDHVHLFVNIPSTITIADLVKQVKGTSSHFVNETLQPDGRFKWQGNYGAFTVSHWDIDKIIGYVKRQKEHHGAADVWSDFEEAFEEIAD